MHITPGSLLKNSVTLYESNRKKQCSSEDLINNFLTIHASDERFNPKPDPTRTRPEPDPKNPVPEVGSGRVRVGLQNDRVGSGRVHWIYLNPKKNEITRKTRNIKIISYVSYI